MTFMFIARTGSSKKILETSESNFFESVTVDVFFISDKNLIIFKYDDNVYAEKGTSGHGKGLVVGETLFGTKSFIANGDLDFILFNGSVSISVGRMKYHPNDISACHYIGNKEDLKTLLAS